MARYMITRPWFGVEEGQIITSDDLHPALKSHVRELAEEEVSKVAEIEPETGEELTETEPETGYASEPVVDEDTPLKSRRGRKATS